MKKLVVYIRLLRPHHWVKNILLFAPLVFSRGFFIKESLLATLYGFVVFSLVASVVYIVNDIVDSERDSLHPQKKFRPLAAGMIGKREAIVFAAFIGLFSFIFAWQLNRGFFYLLALYFLLNIFYSFWLKYLPILDLMVVSGFYLMRIFAGGILAGVPVSEFLILTTFFMALFVIATKRSQELSSALVQHERSSYTPEFLGTLSIVAASAAIIFYAQYALTKPELFFWSLFFVFYVLLRYAYVVFVLKKKEEPVNLVLHDPMILIGSFGWIGYIFLLLYIV